MTFPAGRKSVNVVPTLPISSLPPIHAHETILHFLLCMKGKIQSPGTKQFSSSTKYSPNSESNEQLTTKNNERIIALVKSGKKSNVKSSIPANTNDATTQTIPQYPGDTETRYHEDLQQQQDNPHHKQDHLHVICHSSRYNGAKIQQTRCYRSHQGKPIPGVCNSK